ncbi:unnamed protein product [Rotaria sordida]|uniref:Uncharacterized protein n=1 Tax=Rotaria sordida TaxID=392033 RepID=A0A819PBH1_9BILA|nr:unnamed protein product [Rotaria sordida]CAF1421217.1 unnamed protein product [Rotaria sordida]CAF1462119.1 unnamed protein product [Rotaria sordida]CAF1491264.1 unnamed protein product [Rotaria sordida]CAF1618630.1 unnamed protein product [Rotaria sordida]
MTSAQTSILSKRVSTFLQQKPDHDWLMIPLNDKGGKDQFKNIVVYAIFSSNLNRDDFAYYIDMTFCDLSEDMRKRMKGLYLTNSHSFQQEDIVFDYAAKDGKISASLLQIVAQKNRSNQLEVLVGVISLIRTPLVGWHFNNDYWKSDKCRVQRGLQYIFASEAQKELSRY